MASKSGWIGIFEHNHPDTPQRFRLEYGEVRDLRFSPDGRYLAILNESHVTHLWNLRALREELAALP